VVPSGEVRSAMRYLQWQWLLRLLALGGKHALPGGLELDFA